MYPGFAPVLQITQIYDILYLTARTLTSYSIQAVDSNQTFITWVALRIWTSEHGRATGMRSVTGALAVT